MTLILNFLRKSENEILLGVADFGITKQKEKHAVKPHYKIKVYQMQHKRYFKLKKKTISHNPIPYITRICKGS